eukprot:11036188-Heterocapsa_arctica.AAC.1
MEIITKSNHIQIGSSGGSRQHLVVRKPSFKHCGSNGERLRPRPAEHHGRGRVCRSRTRKRSGAQKDRDGEYDMGDGRHPDARRDPGRQNVHACHKKSCITCMAIQYTQQLGRERIGSEAKHIIELIQFKKENIDKMNSLQIMGFLAE